MKKDRIVQKEKLLEPDYVPEQLIDRDREMGQMERFLLPVHERSSTLLLHGPSGGGKTACTRKLLEELQEDTTADTVYIDCWEYRTGTAVLVRILIDLGIPVPRKGKPVDTLYEKVERQTENRNLVVGLDSVGLPDVSTGVLYTLGKLAGKGLSLILIVNSSDSLTRVEKRVRSRAIPVKIRFDPYLEEEIFEILRDRAKSALVDGSHTEGSLRRIAEIVSEQGGNCRIALAVLKVSARTAEREGEEKVTEEVVDDAAEKFKLKFGGDEDEEA